MTSFKEQEPEKVAEFLDILDNLKDLPIVYIDETGIDRYLYRPYAGAPRGEKVYEKISGRRFERTSIVAGQVGGEFIAPMIYKKSMTSDFFVEWFKTQLLPALKTPHVIVMGNASFHPKNILDELCIQDKHFFLPLPPYSPDLNPIEQAWAILKKKVTDLLSPNHSYLSQLDVTYNPPDLMSHFLPPHEVSFTFCCSSIVFPR
ncbi:TPA: transposase [Streptococcus pneumoniae]